MLTDNSDSRTTGAYNRVHAIARLVEGLVGADLFGALAARETLLVKVFALKHQVGLAGQNGLGTFGARFSLFFGKTIGTKRLLVLVRIDAFADQFLVAQLAHQTVVVKFARLECNYRVQDGL